MIARLPRTYYLLVNPPIAVSTKDVYEALAPRLWFMAHETRKNATHAMLRAIRAKDIVRMANALYNDLEIVVQDVHPVINEIKQGLRALGAIGALMSGSGPTVFGLFRSRETCDTAAKTMRSHYPSFNVTTT